MDSDTSRLPGGFTTSTIVLTAEQRRESLDNMREAETIKIKQEMSSAEQPEVIKAQRSGHVDAEIDK